MTIISHEDHDFGCPVMFVYQDLNGHLAYLVMCNANAAVYQFDLFQFLRNFDPL